MNIEPDGVHFDARNDADYITCMHEAMLTCPTGSWRFNEMPPKVKRSRQQVARVVAGLVAEDSICLDLAYRTCEAGFSGGEIDLFVRNDEISEMRDILEKVPEHVREKSSFNGYKRELVDIFDYALRDVEVAS